MQVQVREHRPARPPRGAGGVLDDGEIVDARTGMVGAKRCMAQQTVPGDRAGCGGVELRAGAAQRGQRQGERQALRPRQGVQDVHGDDGLRALARGQAGELVGGLVPDDRVPGTVVGEHRPQLVDRVQRIVLDDHRAEPQHRVERDHVLGAVGQHDDHAIAGAHAQLGQSRCGPRHLLAQLPVRGGRAHQVEGDGVPGLGDRALEHRDEAVGRQLDPLRDARLVVRGPGRGRDVVVREAGCGGGHRSIVLPCAR